MNIRSSGVFGDLRSGGGLYRGMPSDVIARRQWFVKELDFTELECDAANWTVTNITSGTAAKLTGTNAIGQGGIFRLTATTADQGLGSVQYQGTNANEALINPANGKTIVYEAIIKCNVWNGAAGTGCSWFAGLARLDTTVMGATGGLLTTGADDCIGFHYRFNDTGGAITGQGSGADTSFNMVNCGTAVASISRVASGITLTDATKYAFGFRVNHRSQTTAEYYFSTMVNNTMTTAGVQTINTREPSTVEWQTKKIGEVVLPTQFAAGGIWVPTFCMIANATAITFDVDRLVVAQGRVI